MKFTIFQHVPYESPGYILDWIKENGHSTEEINFYDHPALPDLKETENLIVMGGPMNIYDDEDYSWLPDERDFIKGAIQQKKKVLGICLGSQFIADALGSKVFRNEHKEVGWFEVGINENMLPNKFKGTFPNRFLTIHWHGDTFDPPPGYNSLASSDATANQGFIAENVAALQFHMEMTPDGLIELIKHNQPLFEADLPFVQKPEQMIHLHKRHQLNRQIMFRFLAKFFEK